MDTQTLKRAIPAVLIAAAFAAGAVHAAQVRLSPESITFRSRDESKTVEVTGDGEPAPAEQIEKVKLMIGDHDYDYMIDVEKSDGRLTISPTNKLEIGSFTLFVSTSYGEAAARVYSPLTEMEDSLQKRADELGVSIDDYKKLLGLYEASPRERLNIGIPSVVYVGRTVEVPILNIGADREFVWRVDGRTVLFGEGPHMFEYTFMDPGLSVVEYTEYKDGTAIAGDTEAVQVITEPAQVVEMQEGRELMLTGPSGYERYVWKVDDNTVAREKDFTHYFGQPGKYTVECLAYTPSSEERGYRQVLYTVQVTKDK